MEGCRSPVASEQTTGFWGATLNKAARVFRVEESRERKRCEERIARHGHYPGFTLPGQMTYLEQKSVIISRQKSYVKAWDEFVAWTAQHAMKTQTLEQLDRALCERINQMFFDGQDLADAMTLVAAARFTREDVPKASVLVKSSRAMKGFSKLDPPQGRLPLPYPVLCLIVQKLWKTHYQVAMWLLLTWGTCARPGEAHRVLVQDVVPPTRLCKFTVVVLNSGHGVLNKEVNQLRSIRQTSKVGESDEAVLLDQPYLTGLGEKLRLLGAGQPPQSHLFQFSMEHGTRLFNQCLQDLSLNQHGLNCVYQIRHGSASTDVLTQHRSLVDVQKRGRWATAKSVRRYSNGGRISQVFLGLSDQQKAQALAAEKWMLQDF